MRYIITYSPFDPSITDCPPQKTLLKAASGEVATEPESTDNIDINIPETVESPVFNATTSRPPEFTETQKKGAIHPSTDILSLKSVVATVILKRKAPQEIKGRG